VSALHIADTGLFVAMGQPSTSRYKAVRRFARRNDITVLLPERVYEELTVDDPDVCEDGSDTGYVAGGVKPSRTRFLSALPLASPKLALEHGGSALPRADNRLSVCDGIRNRRDWNLVVESIEC
jgi:hypothetical protein